MEIKRDDVKKAVVVGGYLADCFMAGALVGTGSLLVDAMFPKHKWVGKVFTAVTFLPALGKVVTLTELTAGNTEDVVDALCDLPKLVKETLSSKKEEVAEE